MVSEQEYDILNVVVDLPPGKQYPRRQAVFANANPFGNPVVGVLTIRQSRSKDGQRLIPGTDELKDSWEYDRYAVLELPFEGGGYRFKLTKPKEEQALGEDAGPYYVFIGTKWHDDEVEEGKTPDKGYDACTCKGFESGYVCKHIVAINELIVSSKLPGLSFQALGDLVKAEAKRKAGAK